MISQVIVNVDSRLKNQAMKKAKKQGIPFSAVLKMAIKAFVSGQIGVGLTENFNAKTRKELDEAIKDVEAGRNLSPVFRTAAQGLDWLEN